MRWEAQPRQAEFLLRTEDEVLYGGAAGGGKTDALLIDAIATCQEHAGAKVMFLRKTFADLNLNGAAIPRSHELLTGRAHWDGQDHRWRFRNGSVLQFGHLQSEKDRYKYQGAQFDRLLWDELTQFTLDEYLFLRTRVRATVPHIRTGIRAATNPGGIGHAWVKDRFVDAAPAAQPFTITDGGHASSAVFIPAKVSDNQALLARDPLYPVRLAGSGEALSRALLEGDWDLFIGQVFTEWRRDVHVVEPFAVPTDWPKWRAVDFGYSVPFCCLWAARAPSGQVYIYRELYETGLLDSEQAAKIRRQSKDDGSMRATFADPSMWAAQHNGHAVTAVATAYADMGLTLTKATNDRLSGKQRVHEALYWDNETEPMLQVFSSCTNLIRTLPALVYDLHRVEDVDSDGEDHAYDALRYLLMGIDAQRGAVQVAPTKYGIGTGSNRPKDTRPALLAGRN